ncbi:unnamed protein product [Adineta ricciae]|uniref:B box-type domain-containing protein n=1 Tax=Adineta ricciae TaxID=249248 RepID=A0A814PKC4_ADIRI|nr:unnamed protein product [Adineta ricciae]CAF1107213.1 unnamed protein product [Adineta ricciae]
MTLEAERKACATCSKTGCTAMCYGCQQTFCTKHFIKHRSHLSQQMKIFHQKQDIFYQDLVGDTFEHPLLESIQAWERKSISRIQEIADKTRNDLQQWIEKTKGQVQDSLKQIDEQVQSSEKTDNYTELDFTRWNKQLEELRDLLEKPSNVSIVEDEKPWSVIRTIKLIEKRPSAASSLLELTKADACPEKAIESHPESFVIMFGPCKLSDNNQVVTHSNYRAGLSQTTGINQYSSGRHSITFRIENKGNKNIFLGIISSSHQIISPTFDYSVHGWWNLDHTIINGESKGGESDESLEKDDQVTLVIDCGERQIELEHHRIKRRVHLQIKHDVCPYPWKILVRLLTAGDSIRIL